MEEKTTDATPLDVLLQRSEAFEAAILACFPVAGHVSRATNRRGELVATACVLSAEHARMLRAAFAQRAPNAGAALLRLQYEALLRAVWLMFAAIPPQVETLDRSPDFAAAQAAGSVPGFADMLEAVAREAPLGMSAPLAEFNHCSRRALHAFEPRQGVAALRGAQAPPDALAAASVVRFSNALMCFAYRLLAGFADNERPMDRVTGLYLQFADCVPMPQRMVSGAAG